MPNTLHIYTPLPPPSQPLKTGQTTSYETGDDGDLEKGIAKEYTILTTGRYSGTTNITINSKTHALSNNCVKDNPTGLMWARYVPLDDIGPDSDGKLHWIDSANTEDIFSFVSRANANSLGGYNDWRIPNYFELVTILNLGTFNPPTDTTAFPSTPTTNHWTSTTYPFNTVEAFTLHFGRGYLNPSNKALGKSYCRLVRA